MRSIVDQTVVSVGPYMFHNAFVLAHNCLARSGGSASPPHNAVRDVLPDQPASKRSRQVAGVACMSVGFTVSMQRIRFLPLIVAARLAISTRPPTINGK